MFKIFVLDIQSHSAVVNYMLKYVPEYSHTLNDLSSELTIIFFLLLHYRSIDLQQKFIPEIPL